MVIFQIKMILVVNNAQIHAKPVIVLLPVAHLVNPRIFFIKVIAYLHALMVIFRIKLKIYAANAQIHAKIVKNLQQIVHHVYLHTFYI